MITTRPIRLCSAMRIVDGTVGWLGSVGEQSGKSITLDPPELAGHSPGPVQHGDLQCLHTELSRRGILAAVRAERAYRQPRRIIETKSGTEPSANDLGDGIG